jgi:hypothetical protein
MFQLGSITGLFSSQIETVQQTSKSIGEVIDDMAKTSADVPMSMLAPVKSLAVATGSFSKATVTKTTTEEDLKAVQAAAEAEAAAAALATAQDAAESAMATADAVAAESSNGAKTPVVSQQSVSLNVLNTKTTLGGRMDKSRDPHSGSNLAHMPPAKSPTHTVRSAILEAQREQRRQEQAFKREFCDQMPYPECAMCPYATRTMYVESDLDKLLSQLETIIGLLVKGLYSLSAGLFQCPGQLRAMVTGKFFPFGDVVVASAMSALATLVAVRGAMKHFEGLVASVKYTDFRGELTRMVKTLFKSGALIGMPKAFTNEIGRLLKDIGYSANNVAKMVSGKTPAKGTKYGPRFSVYGDKSYDARLLDGYYRTAARRAASQESTDKANKTLQSVSSSMKAAANASSSASGNIPPTSMVEKFTVSTDKEVAAGKEYFVLNPNATSDSDKYISLETLLGRTPDIGSSLDSIIAIYGDLFVHESSGKIFPTPTPTTDTVAKEGTKYYFKDPITGRFIELPLISGMSLDFSSMTVESMPEELKALANKLGIPLAEFLEMLKSMTLYAWADPSYTNGSGESYTKVTETSPIEGREYYYQDATTGKFIAWAVSPSFPESTDMFIKNVPLAGEDKYATPYKCSGVCVLDNGLIISEPTFLDAESHRMAIDTRSLITVTHVLAGDMASIEGIGLSPYEIKMAYLLDHERNGSIMPDDVNAKLVTTVLDEISLD